MDHSEDSSQRIDRIFRSESDFETNVFVMMRYRGEPYYLEIEKVIRSSLASSGLTPHLARDRSLVDSLWENVKTYMDNCNYGVAVFEDIDVREYNPNISIELGYMMGQGKRCLLLKEKRMPQLPTDVVGNIYRSFDKFDIAGSIGQEVGAWARNDLGVSEPDEIARIFLGDSRRALKLQKLLRFLYNATQPVTPHKIERHLHPGIGDFTTEASKLIQQLLDLRVIQFHENPETFGSYYLSERVRRRLSRLFDNCHGAT